MTNNFEYLLALANKGAEPRRIHKNEEHIIQSACVQWFRYQFQKYSHNLFAVPNGGSRVKAEAAKLIGEGVLAGVADLILLKSNNEYGALLIEMKTATGRQSPAQKEWQQLIEKDGYKYVVCRSLEDFQREVTEYLNPKKL